MYEIHSIYAGKLNLQIQIYFPFSFLLKFKESQQKGKIMTIRSGKMNFSAIKRSGLVVYTIQRKHYFVRKYF